MRSEEDVLKFFDAIAHRYDREHALEGPVSRERLRAMESAIHGKHRVLVLGLGTGRELPTLLDHGHAVTGIELAPRMIAECAKRARTVPIVEQSFWDPLAVADGAYDAVIALHGTLAHPPDEAALPRLLCEIHRVLDAGGVFFAEVPTTDGVERLSALAAPSFSADGEGRFTHRDLRTEIAIGGMAFSPSQWQVWLAPQFECALCSISPFEIAITARRLVGSIVEPANAAAR